MIMDGVEAWLKSLGLEKYAPAFRDKRLELSFWPSLQLRISRKLASPLLLRKPV